MLPQGNAQTFTIQTTFANLPDGGGGDLWQASYVVGGGNFDTNFGFSIAFGPGLFQDLASPPPPVNPDWDVLSLQPDPALPANGLYDALALNNGASLANPFTITFVWLGGPTATPGSQTFTINQFDAGGNLVRIVQSGVTNVIPEPGAGWLVLAALLVAVGLRRSRRRPALSIAMGLIAVASVSAAPLDELSVEGYDLVSEQRITRTIFEYTYRARVRNSGNPGARLLTGVTGTVSSLSPSTTVVDAQITVGTILVRGQVITSDTFSFRQNRTLPFNPSNLRWTFAGTIVAPTAPTLTNLSAPATVPRGGTAPVTFDFADADGDVEVLIVATANPVRNQTSRVGADILALGGASGHASVPINTNGLPFGPTNFTFQLRDHTGLTSASVPFTLTVVGAASGGAAPTVTNLAPEFASYGRPSSALAQVRPRFTFDFTDADGDIDRARVRLTDPVAGTRTYEVAAAGLGLTGTSGRAVLAPFDIRQDASAGNFTYSIQLTLYDRNGNASTPASASFTVPQFGGAQPAFSFYSATPNQGAPGTEIRLDGSQITAAGIYSAELNGMPCSVVSVDTAGIVVRIPEGALTGPFVVSNRFGRKVITSFNFTVPAHIVLAPTEASVPVGQTLAFDARPATRAAEQGVAWSVNGVAGGSASTGTITPFGVFTAPANVPASGSVQVSATLLADANVVASTMVAIVPPTPLPGGARILRSTGGTLVAADNRASVYIPAGALAADTDITIQTLVGAAVPPPRPGRRVLGAVRLGPDGTQFTQPAQVLIPLARAYPPGTLLPVVFYTGNKGGGYVDEGVFATVVATGDRALAPLSHFSVPVIDELVSAKAPITAPTLTSLTPAVIEEGARTPLRLMGAELSADLRVEIRDALGAATTDIVPDTLFTLGSQAGVTLEVKTLPNFDSGERNYRLRLVRPNGEFAELPFAVSGLPEMRIAAGSPVTINDPIPRRYSTFVVDPGARLLVRGGLLDITTTGPLIVEGIIDARGADGAPGVKQEGGAENPETRTGGRGGKGRSQDNFVVPGGPGSSFAFDAPPPENYGQPGNDSVGFSAEPPFQPTARPPDAISTEIEGLGGYPGRGYSPDLFSLVATIGECVLSFGIACPAAVLQLIDEINNAVDALNGGTAGLRGLAAVNNSPLPSTGGGGGGGGGRIELSLSIPGLSFLGEISFNVVGGGGGAGGDGGASVRLASQGCVRVAAPGALVDARGGNGGNGSKIGINELTTRVLFISSTSILSQDAPVSPGGGGGGGRSGQITVSGTAGIFTAGPDQLLQGGGRGGLGGVTFINPQTGRVQEGYRIDNASDADGTRRIDRRETIYDPVQLSTRTVGRSVIRLQSIVLPDLGPQRLEVTGELPNQVRTISAFYDPPTRTYRANIVLFPGFNVVRENKFGRVSPLFPLELRPRILSIAQDSDGDGLSDADEAELGTNPNVADTDGDGISDGDEVAFGSNPLLRDTDGDGLSDGSERAAGTNPGGSDTDGDGFFDSAEVFLGSNPLSALSVPLAIPTGTLFASSAAANGSHLTLINPANTVDVGLLGRPNGGFGFGLAFDEFGKLYTANFTELAVFNPLAQSSTPVGSFGSAAGTPLRVLTLAYNPVDRWLYGIELGAAPDFAPTGQLLRIDPTSGAAVRVGAPGLRALHALAFTRTGMLLAAVAGGPFTDALVELNSGTGALVRDIGPLGFGPVFGLAISRQDVVYSSLPFGSDSSQLLTVNVATGAATAGPLLTRNVFDLTVYPCPAPCLALPIASLRAAGGGFEQDIALATGDFDGDGKLDVVELLAVFSDKFLDVRPGDGAGHFATGTRLALPGLQITGFPNAVLAADFNGDGRDDLVCDNPAFGTGGIYVYLSSAVAPGGFSAPVRVGGDNLSGAPVVANFNPLDDAFLDLAAVDSTAGSANQIRLINGDGLGGFTRGAAVPVGGTISAFFAGDLNGDGFVDLVAIVSNTNPATARIFLNDGHGNFSAPPLVVNLGSIGSADAVRIADFDGDGRADLLILTSTSLPDGLLLLRQTAPGVFAAAQTYPYKSFTSVPSIAVGDVTGDGLPDVVLIGLAPTGFDRVLRTYVGDPVLGLRPSTSRAIPNGNGVALGDVDADGRRDIIVTSQDAGVGSVLYFRVEPSF